MLVKNKEADSMNQEFAKEYFQEFLEKPGIINVDAEDVVFILGKEETMERYYGFGVAEKEKGLEVAVKRAMNDLRKSLLEKPAGVILTIHGDVGLAEVNEMASYVADELCTETTNMIFGYVNADPEEPVEVLLVASKRK